MQSYKLDQAEEELNNNNNNTLFNHRSQESIKTNLSLPNKRAQVVIVGAGLAGLAAAQRLYQSGFKDVVVLDAMDRIGGRVHTVDHSGYLLEMGAQWLHGADNNPLYNWLMTMNMLDDFENATDAFNGLYCANFNEEIDKKLVNRILNILFEGKLSIFKNECTNLIEANGYKNAAGLMRHLLDEAVELDHVLKANRPLVDAMFNWFLRFENIENGCDSMGQVSLASYTDYNDVGDGSLLNFKHGYRSLLQCFVDAFPSANWLYLSKEVINIEMLMHDFNRSTPTSYLDSFGNTHSSPILIKYRSKLELGESTPNDIKQTSSIVHSIECDHVIVTASLGFLKQHQETFFTPKLPSIKRDLINAIGFGTVDKIVLQFESPFWQDGIKMIWKNSDDAESKFGIDDEFPIWARDIIAFDVVRRQPNILMGWIGGHGAKLMEQEPNDRVAEVCLRILEKFLPPSHAKPSKLIACFCSRWNSNPFTCGSYSFQSMESFDLQVEKLHEPIYNLPLNPNGQLMVHLSSSRLPRILFAGEATAGPLYSTTHGAVISGWREADRLADCCLNDNKLCIQQCEVVQPIDLQVR